MERDLELPPTTVDPLLSDGRGHVRIYMHNTCMHVPMRKLSGLMSFQHVLIHAWLCTCMGMRASIRMHMFSGVLLLHGSVSMMPRACNAYVMLQVCRGLHRYNTCLPDACTYLVQISDAAHKDKLPTSPATAVLRLYFKSPEVRLSLSLSLSLG